MFEIPQDLSTFSANAVQGFIEQARSQFATLRDAVTEDTVTDEQLAQLASLKEFGWTTGPAEIKARAARSAQFTTVTEDPVEEDETEDDETDAEEAPAEQTEAPAETEPVVAATKAPRIKDVAKRVEQPKTQAPSAKVGYATLVAAAGVPHVAAGTQFTSLLDVAKAFEQRTAGFANMAKQGRSSEVQVYPVAVLERNYPPEFSVNGDETDYQKLINVADERRLPGGSLLASVEQSRQEIQNTDPTRDALVAAAGWCAPSETDYSVCLQITTDGILDVPEVQARRGGIRHNTGVDFSTIFGSGTGFFDLTEAQVAAGTAKGCLEIPCPTFVDTRLGPTGLCLTGNILSIRGYPEYTAAFTRGALAASAHQINREQISDMIADSVAVDLTAAAPWATDGSTVSNVLSAVEMAITDIKYRLRLDRSATLEVVMPFWILGQMRADWTRRQGMDNSQIALADAAINAAFTMRGARVQYVYDWQDAFSNVSATGAGAGTPINFFNKTLQFLVYPAGTWVRAVSDIITLNSVYDSTKLNTNQVTHLFTETGWAMVRMCPLSRVYTVPVCPSGKVTVAGTLTCP
jgi:hypothetical protein